MISDQGLYRKAKSNRICMTSISRIALQTREGDQLGIPTGGKFDMAARGKQEENVQGGESRRRSRRTFNIQNALMASVIVWHETLHMH